MINVGLTRAHPHNPKSLQKKFLKENLADVGMAQCKNALADKVHKQEVACTQ